MKSRLGYLVAFHVAFKETIYNLILILVVGDIICFSYNSILWIVYGHLEEL